MALTAKQERFVAEYLIDLNATQAAIRAGYSEKSAYSQGQRLLKNAEAQAAIQEAKAKRQKRTEITQDRVIEELAKLGFADIRKAVQWGRNPGDTESDNADPNGLGVYPVSLVPSDKVDDDTAAAITEVSLTQTGVKIKMADKRAALDTLLKHMTGMDGDDDAPQMTININSDAPVKDVRVTRSEG
ncbi:terminase small subunit [Maritimibacter sp. UBA3975]|uniref:terminase small subunit n=1 Tax=Maritimibacter sp. UBA3975 TaxID=1946833 RepID=UPI000C09604A|nr:terminase small subunit [Maritimibacter sp. UBA3975]MAM60849.1 terminase small subunit [Maritimibacter sp.]|tara:strand:+ start:4831 stop:5388 length:558 start_codon:yes stop_codon:yes gene_type:complete